MSTEITADGCHLLKEDDLDLLMEKLYDDTVTKWYNLGLALGVRKGQLNVIRDSHKTSANPAEDCLREMLDEWLNNTDQPTWEDVAAALERKAVSKRRLAQTVRQKYCGVVSQGPRPGDEQCEYRSGLVRKSPRSEGSQGRKRERSPELEEFSDVTSLIRASPNAKVHGIVTRLSPMKRGKKSEYFDGELSDGKCKVRLFGFDSVVQKTLAGFQEKGAPVSLEKCAVKSAREGPKFEVLVKNQTVVKPSSTQFDVEVSGSSVGARKEVVKLDEVGGMQEYERVTVVVKAVRVDEPMEVSGGRRKQDVMVSDGEKTMRVTMWEDDIGKLVEGLSYKLAGMMVRSFGPAGKKETYLSTGKQGSTVDEVEDIGAIEEKEGGDGTVRWQLEDVVVVGVPVLDTYLSCLKCSCKVVAKKEMIGLGRCGKCGMLQRLDRCKSQMSAQLLIEVDNTVLTLQAFSRTVIAIAQTDDVTEAALLKAKPFTLRYSEKNVIQSVMRKD